MAPTVTVIVPTYDRPDLIGASITSALSQTFDDLVVCVGDNGGSPLTEDVVRSFADPRVRYLRHERGLGAMGNWLDLIRRAETPLVASLHDDDTWEPTFLEKAVPPMLEDPSLGMAFSDFSCVDEHGALLAEHTEWLTAHSGRDRLAPGRFRGNLEEGLRMAVVRNAPQPAYAAVLRTETVNATEFPEDITPIYDLWLNYRMLVSGAGFFYLPERLTNYRVWNGSLTAVGFGSGLDSVFRRILEESADAGPVVDEIEREWAAVRFARARDLFDDPARRDESRNDMRAAAAWLPAAQRAVAEVAGRSTIGWEAVRQVRRAVQATRRRLRPGSLDSSGLHEDHMLADERARNLTS